MTIYAGCGNQGVLVNLFRGKGVAGGQGFEPRQAESESAVLPLDDPPALWNGVE